MSSQTTRLLFAAIAFLLFSVASAQQAQVLNPLYIQAKGLYQKISDSTLNSGVKKAFGQRLQTLTAEQQDLWQMAGQVDSGRCKDSCIDLYNSRIVNWETKLNSFNSDARKWLSQAQPSVNQVQCLSGCTTREAQCRRDCANVPAERHNGCLTDCYEKETSCTKGCYGINN